MRFKKSPQLPGAGRTWAGHHHGSHTPTSTGAILLSKMACQPKHFGRQCTMQILRFLLLTQLSFLKKKNIKKKITMQSTSMTDTDSAYSSAKAC